MLCCYMVQKTPKASNFFTNAYFNKLKSVSLIALLALVCLEFS